MPLKRAVVPFLHETSPAVRTTGTANTITIRGGRLLGENTDATGMLQALRDAGVTRAASATVLGAGATAATALTVLSDLSCTRVSVVTRAARPRHLPSGDGEPIRDRPADLALGSGSPLSHSRSGYLSAPAWCRRPARTTLAARRQHPA